MKRPKRVLWVIGGGSLQIPVIEEAKKLGLATLVTDMSSTCVARPHADYFYPVDIFDVGGSVDLLFRLRHFENMDIAGVIAAGIDANITAAVLARVAGLPGVDPKAAYITHHKPAFRKFLTEHNLPCPLWEEVSTFAEASAAVKRIGVPFIIKNIDNSGSRGTRKFFSMPSDRVLKGALVAACGASSTKTALIEEMVSGLEQTVETLYDVQGAFHKCFITDRLFDPENEWAVEIGLCQPTSLPSATQEELYALTKKTADLLGITIGAAKADMILTKRGPMMLEMTTRLSGGFDCQYLVPAATGKNVLKSAILTAIGKKFPSGLLTDKKHRVGMTGSVWPKPGEIVSITGLSQAQRIPGVEHIFLRSAVGDTVGPYTDGASRTCFIIVTGKDEDAAHATLEKAQQTIKIVTK